MTDFEFETEIQVRFRDIDTMEHVNNAVYATYLETARVAYFREVLDRDLHRTDTVIARLEIDYRRPIDLGDAVTVALTVPDLGESSIPMEYEIRTDGEVAATAETVQVAFDRESQSSRPIPGDWRERIVAYREADA